MSWLQFAGPLGAAVLAGVIREVVRPIYQEWVVRKVQSGEWTMLQAQKFDHRVDMAIWLPWAAAMGAGFMWFYILVNTP